MSVQAMAWVIDHAEVGGSELLVMLMVANHARSDGTGAFPARDTLAAECRMSERQVRRILQALVAGGHLDIEGISHAGTKAYRVAGMPEPVARPRRKGGHLDPPGGTPGAVGGDIASVGGGDAAVSPDPSLTISEPSRADAQPLRAAAPRSLDEAAALAGGFVASVAARRSRAGS